MSYSLLLGTAAFLPGRATSAGAQHYPAFAGARSAVCIEAVMLGVWPCGDQSSWVCVIGNGDLFSAHCLETGVTLFICIL